MSRGWAVLGEAMGKVGAGAGGLLDWHEARSVCGLNAYTQTALQDGWQRAGQGLAVAVWRLSRQAEARGVGVGCMRLGCLGKKTSRFPGGFDGNSADETVLEDDTGDGR